MAAVRRTSWQAATGMLISHTSETFVSAVLRSTTKAASNALSLVDSSSKAFNVSFANACAVIRQSGY